MQTGTVSILKIRNPLLEEHCAFSDTGLRLDGLLALELWDLIVSGQPDNDVHKHQNSHKRIDVMENIDSVPSNVQSSRHEALLYVFEDNESVIKMIVKERSPTMRDVSRTQSCT